MNIKVSERATHWQALGASFENVKTIENIFRLSLHATGEHFMPQAKQTMPQRLRERVRRSSEEEDRIQRELHQRLTAQKAELLDPGAARDLRRSHIKASLTDQARD